MKDSEYQKWLLADPAAAQRAWQEARDYSCAMSYNRLVKDLKPRGLGGWERWDLTWKYHALPMTNQPNHRGQLPPAWEDCVRHVTLRADKVLGKDSTIEDLDLTDVNILTCSN